MTFEAIKQCAMNNDVAGLKRIIDPPQPQGFISFFTPPVTKVSIDIRKAGATRLTPASELAREGKLEAVELLRQHGASVNAIARGFAMGGHTEDANRYRKAFGASVHSIAMGFAIAGHAEDAIKYHSEFNASGIAIMIGFAMGGHTAHLNRYRKKFTASVHQIAFAYALCGQSGEVEKYRIQFGASVHYIAAGFATGGNIDQAERYHRKFGASINMIAYGFAVGGHTAEAERYREKMTMHSTDSATNQVISETNAVSRNAQVTFTPNNGNSEVHYSEIKLVNKAKLKME